ncbi:aminotransferase class I/II-fold pyridoxal phosphate-dependent enzyme [candidate division KSB3 bacterium]|uniref:Probable serine hydroxymethyltransferase n=1 Tax=candidate division KSB3 bacterium TaxID=2044937 RepID=A0A9D5Q6V7_9BACT|nr:aminotransferase class I/II-fold pyridoxal phosphate-dependent enzyme [candidate division KSB3 bacterium]MBD3325632.1 aminotransferase class I/II-fold pyridoxal phosphate-dependent enzyme [candidate division KSB3 bacterium]
MTHVLRQEDPAVADLLTAELHRQQSTVDMIAAENSAPPAILEAGASVFANKAAEGYPGKRFHAGCEHTDTLESLAIDRAKTLFDAEYANVQPHSGVNANLAVYCAALTVGDPILSMKLEHGGHLSHGAAMSLTSQCYQFAHYGVHRATERLDYDEVLALARRHRPKMIVGGASSYPRLIEYPTLREIADEVGAYLLIDMAHIAGLVAAGVIPSPVPYADFVTFTTYKTLMGGRGGVILCKARSGNAIDRAVFPGTQGTPAVQMIAAKAVCFHRAMSSEFRTLQAQILRNARRFGQCLESYGYRLVTGGTDTHLVLVDLQNNGLTGNVAETTLERIGILANKNVIPYDPENPMITSGLRFGTPALTTRGMREPEMERLAALVHTALTHAQEERIIADLRQQVHALCQAFPLYQDFESALSGG